MLQTLSQAKAFAQNKIAEYQKGSLEDVEKDILDTLLEDAFFEKIEKLISEEAIEEKRLESEDALDAFLFHTIPNYTTLLEETTAEVIADYLMEETQN